MKLIFENGKELKIILQKFQTQKARIPCLGVSFGEPPRPNLEHIIDDLITLTNKLEELGLFYQRRK